MSELNNFFNGTGRKPKDDHKSSPQSGLPFDVAAAQRLLGDVSGYSPRPTSKTAKGTGVCLDTLRFPSWMVG